MSIINTFDYDGEEIIKPGNNVRTIVDFPQTVLVVFSVKMRDLFLNTYHPSKIGALYAAGWELPIWQFEYKGRKIGFSHTILGGAGAAALLEELLALGAKKCLYFGVCGALDKEIAAGHLLVPTAAYRDEGVSYHYAQSSDYIEIETAPKLARIFEEMQVPYNTTKTWTTDAFYRETKRNMERRKEE